MNNEVTLLAVERKSRILAVLQREGTIRTAELVDMFKVSAMTIRSDLRELEKDGECELIWGGAISKTPPPDREAVIQQRTELNRAAKQRIGKKAAELIQDGQTIFVDAGTTTVELVHQLPRDLDYLRIITPALNVAVAATHYPYIELVMPGGILRNLTRSLVGTQATRSLELFNADVVFLGTGGFSVENGITTGNILELEIKRAMVRQAKSVILTVDSSKYGRTHSLNVAPIHDVDMIITDNQLGDDDAKILTDSGIKLYRV